MNVSVSLGVKRVGEVELPFVSVVMPSTLEAVEEMGGFSPTDLRLADPGPDSMALLLSADGEELFLLTPEHGDMLGFVRAIQENPVMLVSLYLFSPDRGSLYNRTLVSNAFLGRILSDTGPRRLMLGMPGDELDALRLAGFAESLEALLADLDETGRGLYNRRLDPSRAN